MKTAYAYARFSSDNQREVSIDAQLRAINEYCDTNDIKILRIFKDEAQSARTAKRPAFQEMFGLIKEQPADYVIVHKLDRFARSRADAAFYRQKLKDAGMRLISVIERLDDSPESIIMEGILESMNEYYSANLARETKKGQKENILRGKRCGGKTPYGYTSVNQQLVPNQDADTVRDIFRLYADGWKIADIVRKLNPKVCHIDRILGNGVYTGALVFGELRKENAHEALVSKETWEAVCRRRGNSRMNAANKAKNDYMLSGMLVCGKCGRTMVGLCVKDKYMYYNCRTKNCTLVKSEELEDMVIKELSKVFTPTDDLKALFFDLVSKRVNSREEDENAKKAEYILRQRISKLIDSLQYAETQEDTKAIMEKVNELRRQMPEKPKPKREVSREDCDRFIERFCDIESMDRDEQKSLLKSVVDKIVVNGMEISLFMNVKAGVCVVVNKKGVFVK